MGYNGLTPQDFYKQLAKWMDTKPYTAQKWWEASLEVIIRECFYNEKCKVPGLGEFILEQQKETIQHQIINGEEKFYKVPEHFSVKFKPNDTFINDVNGQGITKAYRKRLKKQELTRRDIERQLRFEQMKAKPSEDGKVEAIESLDKLFKKKKGLVNADGEDGE